jgi:hypothetical protein
MFAAEYELAGKVPGDQELRLRVAMHQSRRAAPAGPGHQPVQVGVDLALDVVVSAAAGLDDES